MKKRTTKIIMIDIIRAILGVFILHMLFVSCRDKSSPTEQKEERLTETYGIDYEHPEKVQYFSGHVFVELFVNDSWMLFDPTSRIYIPDYDPTNPIIPITNSMENKGYYVMFKGLDPANYGIKDIQLLNDEQKLYADKIKKDFDDFVFPNYTIMRL